MRSVSWSTSGTFLKLTPLLPLLLLLNLEALTGLGVQEDSSLSENHISYIRITACSEAAPQKQSNHIAAELASTIVI